MSYEITRNVTAELESKFDTGELNREGLLPPKRIDSYLLLMIDEELRRPLAVGRRDLVTRYIPDIDLQPYGGRNSGVSRKHLTIDCEGRTFELAEATTNQSYRNGVWLRKGQVYPLEDGDYLILGQLVLNARYVSRNEVNHDFEIYSYPQGTVATIADLASKTSLRDALFTASRIFRAERHIKQASLDEPMRAFYIGKDTFRL